jgi:hypothetical protein
MDDKKKFTSQVEKQLESWNSELLKFRVIAEVADPDAQVEHYQLIEDIVEKEHSVREKLAELQQAPDNRCDEYISEIMDLWREVDDVIEDARIQIN